MENPLTIAEQVKLQREILRYNLHSYFVHHSAEGSSQKQYLS